MTTAKILVTVNGKLALTTRQVGEEYTLGPEAVRQVVRRSGLHPIAHLDGRTPLYAATEVRRAFAARPGRGGPGVKKRRQGGEAQ